MEWTLFGSKFSRTALVFICQVIILYISIITCFVNLTVHNGSNELWITVLSLSLGTIYYLHQKLENQKLEEEEEDRVVMAVYLVNHQLIHFHNAKVYS